MSAVPVIDIAPFLAGTPLAGRQVARHLDAVCREVGFFALAGHGVPEAEVAAIHDVSRAFFRGTRRARPGSPSRRRTWCVAISPWAPDSPPRYPPIIAVEHLYGQFTRQARDPAVAGA